MLKPKIKVGRYYEFKFSDKCKMAFAVLYGFERGKNKDVYTLMMYSDGKNFEFPVEEQLFDKWVDEERVREITITELLAHAL